MENQNTQPKGFGHWLKHSLLVKLMAIGVLVILLLIPNFMIQDIISDRQSRKWEVGEEISQSWGGRQNIIGPVLCVPYVEYFGGDKKDIVRKTAYFLPDTFEAVGALKHEIRSRGIFDVVLYKSNTTLSGSFTKPTYSQIPVPDDQIEWENVKIALGISGMNGVKSQIAMQWQGQTLQMQSGTDCEAIQGGGVSTKVPMDGNMTTMDFSIPLQLNGNEDFMVCPVGKTSTVQLTSDWDSPSFSGQFLPDDRTITPKEGFQASWKILDFNRDLPQQWTNDQRPNLAAPLFGVRLIRPVDQYLQNTRAAKYAILVIGLTFLIYFFTEMVRKELIHPFQYFLIGLSLTVFYLLLLSLSEPLGFSVAYGMAAVATIVLIGMYSRSIFQNKAASWQLTGLIAGMYAFIYVVLQLEDYALLVGSIGIFLVLAAAMYYSRNIDWYRIGQANE